MRDILPSEWQALTIDLAAAVQTRWPWLRVTTHGRGMNSEVSVKSDALGGSLDLHSDDRASLLPAARIGSCSFPTGETQHVRVSAKMAIAVCDALDLAVTLADVRVWPKDAPCSMCSGRGTQRCSKCTACGGSGVRNEEEAAS